MHISTYVATHCIYAHPNFHISPGTKQMIVIKEEAELKRSFCQQNLVALDKAEVPYLNI